MSATDKTPTRPGSKWATGRRRVLNDPPREKAGFHQGALVDPQAAARAALKPRSRKPRAKSPSSRRRTAGRVSK